MYNAHAARPETDRPRRQKINLRTSFLNNTAGVPVHLYTHTHTHTQLQGVCSKEAQNQKVLHKMKSIATSFTIKKNLKIIHVYTREMVVQIVVYCLNDLIVRLSKLLGWRDGSVGEALTN